MSETNDERPTSDFYTLEDVLNRPLEGLKPNPEEVLEAMVEATLQARADHEAFLRAVMEHDGVRTD